jgi:flavodoxin
MAKIGLFYGTDTGNTETVSKDIVERLEGALGEGSVDLHEIYQKKKDDIFFLESSYIFIKNGKESLKAEKCLNLTA